MSKRNWVRSFFVVASLAALTPSAFSTAERQEQDAAIIAAARRLFSEDRNALICRNAHRGPSKEVVKVPKMYFSWDLMKYFLMVCGVGDPKPPNLIRTDFLDGESLESCNDSTTREEEWKPCVSDYLFEAPVVKGTTATVKIRYHGEDWKKLYTRLYLVREGDSWKVDDIEVWGDVKGFGVEAGAEGYGSSFRSLKAQLRKDLRAR